MPGGKVAGIGRRIGAGEEVVEGVIAGHFEQAAVLMAHPQTDGFALVPVARQETFLPMLRMSRPAWSRPRAMIGR